MLVIPRPTATTSSSNEYFSSLQQDAAQHARYPVVVLYSTLVIPFRQIRVNRWHFGLSESRKEFTRSRILCITLS